MSIASLAPKYAGVNRRYLTDRSVAGQAALAEPGQMAAHARDAFETDAMMHMNGRCKNSRNQLNEVYGSQRLHASFD
jgi:hypothetical protein